jgi:hypothetical protein
MLEYVGYARVVFWDGWKGDREAIVFILTGDVDMARESRLVTQFDKLPSHLF